LFSSDPINSSKACREAVVNGEAIAKVTGKEDDGDAGVSEQGGWRRIGELKRIHCWQDFGTRYNGRSWGIL
jgi:hypothetical protein